MTRPVPVRVFLVNSAATMAHYVFRGLARSKLFFACKSAHHVYRAPMQS